MTPTSQEIIAVIMLTILVICGMILVFRAAKAELMARGNSEYHLHGGF